MTVAALDWTDVLDLDGRYAPLVHLGATAQTVAQHNAGIAYLATPYTREVMLKGKWNLERSVMMSTLAARHLMLLMREGVTAVSPIVLSAEALHAQHTVPGGKLKPFDAAFWAEWCRPLLTAARMVVVPNIPGWRHSQGVWEEVQFALSYNVPVFIYEGARDAV